MIRFFGMLTVVVLSAGLLLMGYPATPETSVYADGHYGGGSGTTIVVIPTTTGAASTGGTSGGGTGDFFGSTGDISVTGDNDGSENRPTLDTPESNTTTLGIEGLDVSSQGSASSASDAIGTDLDALFGGRGDIDYGHIDTSYAGRGDIDYSGIDFGNLSQSTLFTVGEGQAVIIGNDGSVLFSQSGGSQGGPGSDATSGGIDLHLLSTLGFDLPEGYGYISQDVSVSVGIEDASGGYGQGVQLDVGSYLQQSGVSLSGGVGDYLEGLGLRSGIADVGGGSEEGRSTQILQAILAVRSDAAIEASNAVRGLSTSLEVQQLGSEFAEQNLAAVSEDWVSSHSVDPVVMSALINEGSAGLTTSERWRNALGAANDDTLDSEIAALGLSIIQGSDALLIPPDQADSLFDRAVFLSVPDATSGADENASGGVIEPGYIDVTTGLWQAMSSVDRLGTDAGPARSVLSGLDFDAVRTGKSAMGTDGLGDLLASILGGATGEDDATSGTTAISGGWPIAAIFEATSLLDLDSGDYDGWNSEAAANYVGLVDPNVFVSESSTDTLTGVAAALGHGVGELIDSEVVVSDMYRAWVSELEFNNPNADLGGFSNEILTRSAEVELDSYTTDAAVGLVNTADDLHTVPDANLFSVLNTRPVDLIGAHILDEIYGTLTAELIVALDNEQAQDAVRIMDADRLQQGTFAEIAAGNGQTAGTIYEALAGDDDGFVINVIELSDAGLVDGALDVFEGSLYPGD